MSDGESDELRKVSRDLAVAGQLVSASVWGEQVATCCGWDAKDLVFYLRCLLEKGDCIRVISIMKERCILYAHPVYRLLAARAHLGAGLASEAYAIASAASDSLSDEYSTRKAPKHSAAELEFLQAASKEMMVDASLDLVAGCALIELENRSEAAKFIMECLLKNPFIYQAFDLLITHNLASNVQIRSLLDKLPTANSVLRTIYETRLSSNVENAPATPPPIYSRLLQGANSLLLRASQAQKFYYLGHYKKALELCRWVHSRDEFYPDSLPIYICLLVELDRKTELFKLAHKMVDLYPDWSLTWYGVGCYYYTAQNLEQAKKYLAKSASMKSPYGPGWLLLGHCFAEEGEHDQAINCYLRAAKIIPNAHLPLLYMGLVYSMTNHLKLGEKFLNEALLRCPDDPFVLNELGVLAYRQKQYEASERFFTKTIRHVTKCLEHEHPNERCSPTASSSRQKMHGVSTGSELALEGMQIPQMWEPTLTNLGHSLRKQNRYNEAILYYRKALSLSSDQKSVYGSLGITYLLDEKYEEGVYWLNKTLCSRDGDKMLGEVLEIAMKKWDQTSCPETVMDENETEALTPSSSTSELFGKMQCGRARPRTQKYFSLQLPKGEDEVEPSDMSSINMINDSSIEDVEIDQ